jgi:very-short-patch-repair endonuclease
MGPRVQQSSAAGLWALAREQHWVVSRAQMLALGFSPKAIAHRLKTGEVHRIRNGVYSVGRPEISRLGEFMAAVLACGPAAFISHHSAAELWEIRPPIGPRIHVSIVAAHARRRPGLMIHRRVAITDADVTRRHGIPVTTPTCTLIDIAPGLDRATVEAAINEGNKRNLIDPDDLRTALEPAAGRPGVATVREVLTRSAFRLTDSELERLFLPIAENAGLRDLEAQQWVNGFRVDFLCREIGLVIETDGLRYHRTPSQQARDRLRDQTHAAAGLTTLRFTYAQIRFEPEHVERILRSVVARLTNDC